MWTGIVDILQRAPEIALFLSLAIGYRLGSIPIFGVTLGATVSTLLAAIAIGQVGITVDPLIKSVLFALFIFIVGYRSGPQFVASFKRAAGSQLAIAVMLAGCGVLATIVVARLFGLDKGAAAGLMAGALTQSPALGTATDAIGRLGLPADQVKTLADSAAVAYAVTYLFGEFGLLMCVRNIVPLLLRVDLKQSARKLETEMHETGSDGDGAHLIAYQPLDVRAYRVSEAVGSQITVVDLEARIGDRAFIARVRQGDAVRPAQRDLVLHPGDVICLVGHRATLADKTAALLGAEVDDAAVLGVTLQPLDVVVTNPTADGKSLAEIAAMVGIRTRGLSIASIHRALQPLPVTPGTRLHTGDVVRVVGDEPRVKQAAEFLGYADWPTDKSDLVFVGLGIVSGTLLGLLSVPVFGVPLTLGTGGGVLVAGLLLGWLRSRRPTFGRVPPAAQWVLSDFGLNGFIATIGLSIGGSAIHAIAQHGIWLLVGGVIVTLGPLLVATMFGAWVLKMNPVILCGALAGAQTNAAVLNAVNETSDSSLPALGFTLPFAVNNMLLTVAGPIIVALV